MSRSTKRSKAKKRHHHQKHKTNTANAVPGIASGAETACPTEDTQTDVPSGRSPRTLTSPRPSVGNVEPLQPRLSKSSSLTTATSLAVSEVDNLESLLDGLTGADLRTGALILQALRKPEDLSRLRQLAVTHGFVNERIRAVVWPRLLGLRPPKDSDLKLDHLTSVHPPPVTKSWTAAAGGDRGDRLCPSASASSQAHNGVRTMAGHKSPPPSDLRPSADRPCATSAGANGRDCSAGKDPGQLDNCSAGKDPGQLDSRVVASVAQGSGRGDCRCDDTRSGGPASPQRAGTDFAADGRSVADLAPAAAVAGARTYVTADHGAANGAQNLPCPTSQAPAQEPAAGEDGASGGRRGRDAEATDVAAAAAASAVSSAQRLEGLRSGNAGARRCSSAGERCPGGAGQARAPLAPLATDARSDSEGAGGCASTQPGDRCDTAAVESPDDAAEWAVRQGAVVSPVSSHDPTAVDRAPRCSSCGGARHSEASSSRGCSRRGSQSLVPEPDLVCDADQDRERGSCGGQGRQWDSDWNWDWRQYLHWSGLSHRDSAVVEVDVARSLWAFTRGLSDPDRDARRQQLKRLLNAVVAAHGGDVFYYQGLHDVAGVLLLSLPGAPPPPQPPRVAGPVCLHGDAASPATDAGASRPESGCLGSWGSDPAPCDLAANSDAPAVTAARPTADAAAATAARGELLAFALLRRLVTTHLRDATRPSLEPVVQLLGLVPHLVHAADPALSRHLGQLGLQPFFALSWFLTWWAHEMDDLAHAARLFDFFLASHPLMPLYLGAVAMRSQRAALLTCEDMPELHSALTNLKLVGPNDGGGGRASGGGTGRAPAAPVMPLEQLLWQAEQLWRGKPPHVLLPARPTRGSLSQVRQRRGGAGDANVPRRASGGSAAGDGRDGEGLALTACVAHAARMEGRPALWRVPDAAPAEWPADVSEGGSGLGRILARANSALGGRSRTALLSTALLAGVYVAAAVAIGYATFSRATMGQQ